MKPKNRNGLPLHEFLKEELVDPGVRKRYEAAKTEWPVAKANVSRVDTFWTLSAFLAKLP